MEAKLSDLEAISKLIVDNMLLAQFIKALEPENRLKAYEQLVPHLSFKAAPYWWLMARRKKNAEKEKVN